MKQLLQMCFFLFLLSPIILGGSVVSAREQDHRSKPNTLRVISKGRAISAVKAELKGKILSIKMIPGNGPPVYRVKILLAKGRVRTVFVDGVSGQVIRIR